MMNSATKLSLLLLAVLLFVFMADHGIHCAKFSSSPKLDTRRMKELDQLEDVLSETNKILDYLKNSALTTADEEVCEDKSKRCAKMKKRAENSNTDWAEECEKRRVANICKKTCGKCDDNGGNGGEKITTKAPVITKAPRTKPATITKPVTTKVPIINKTDGVAECNDQNRDHCQCGNPDKGFTTYVFKLNDTTRCFTVFRPKDLPVAEKLPVMITSHCYGKDRLSTLSMTSPNTVINKLAHRFGFARIGVSTPKGNWVFGNDGVINDQHPMPCSAKDSIDAAFINKVFDFISANPGVFNVKRVYTEGFSQNGIFSAYIGYCHSDKVVGVWQAGSGMGLTSQKNYFSLHKLQTECTRSMFKEYSKDCVNQPDACPNCQYWPIYPCYTAKRPVIGCVVDYIGDPITSMKGNPNVSTTWNMYRALVREGHDARLMRFDQLSGHAKIKNNAYWKVACLGITSPCTAECERSFIECMKTSTFTACIDEKMMKELKGCTGNCSPTFGMMSQSEAPFVKEFSKGKFGASDEKYRPQPQESVCQFDQVVRMS